MQFLTELRILRMEVNRIEPGFNRTGNYFPAVRAADHCDRHRGRASGPAARYILRPAGALPKLRRVDYARSQGLPLLWT